MSIPAQGAEGAETMTAGQSLDFRVLHAANIARQAEWCPDQVPDLSFRGNELGGECGEAQNVIKKLERERQGWRGSRATKDDLADELADVVICADLCAVTADIDLGAAVRRKFNATSEKQGLSVFLPLPALASPRADSEERTAGWGLELIAEIKRLFGRAVEEDGRLCDAEDAIDDLCDAVIDRLRSTPAHPAGGVPDSLRALLDAVRPFYACVFNDNGDVSISTGNLTAHHWLALDRAFHAVNATHPAGQSTGSGTEDADLQRVKAAARDLRERHGGNGWDAKAAADNRDRSKGDKRAFWQAVHDHITARQSI